MVKSKNFYRDKAERILKYANAISKRLENRKLDKHLNNKKSEEDEILEDLKKAHEEWMMKEEYFQWATDPDLIEHATYELKASKLKYIYYLKKAKELGNK